MGEQMNGIQWLVNAYAACTDGAELLALRAQLRRVADRPPIGWGVETWLQRADDVRYVQGSRR